MDFPDFSDTDEAVVQFHSADIDFELPDIESTASWVINTILAENKQLEFLNFIFCNDSYLHKINVKFLDHDTLTDVITFPYSELDQPIEGDIYISIDRIKENATTFKASFHKELKRVMIHGVLHLCGYGDKSKREKLLMREKEDFYINQQ